MMAKHEDESRGGQVQVQRLPYQCPAIEETTEFETLALQCSSGGACGGEEDPFGIPSS